MSAVHEFPIVSDQITRRELAVILRELQAVVAAGVRGDVVELGCFVGTTSLFLQRALQTEPARRLHVYDSFQGLPAKSAEDSSPAGEQFKQGELLASKAELIKHFKHAGLPMPIIHKAWFEDLTDADMPPTIALAFLDGDFYGSIMASLRAVWLHLHPGAVVVVDDYHTESLPGVRRAVDEWARHHPLNVRIEQSLAIIKPHA